MRTDHKRRLNCRGNPNCVLGFGAQQKARKYLPCASIGFASCWVASCIPLVAIRRWVGHASRQTNRKISLFLFFLLLFNNASFQGLWKSSFTTLMCAPAITPRAEVLLQHAHISAILHMFIHLGLNIHLLTRKKTLMLTLTVIKPRTRMGIYTLLD